MRQVLSRKRLMCGLMGALWIDSCDVPVAVSRRGQQQLLVASPRIMRCSCLRLGQREGQKGQKVGRGGVGQYAAAKQGPRYLGWSCCAEELTSNRTGPAWPRESFFSLLTSAVGRGKCQWFDNP